MRESIFSTIKEYFSRLFWHIRSVCEALATTFPYLFAFGDLHREVTEQYPDPISSKMAEDLPPKSRGLLFNDIDRCTGCRECEKACPTHCIHVETEAGADPQKVWVGIFDIDFSKCVFCGICTESCEPQSLVHTRQYEGAVYSLSDMIANFGRGLVTPEQKSKWAALRQQSSENEVFL